MDKRLCDALLDNTADGYLLTTVTCGPREKPRLILSKILYALQMGHNYRERDRRISKAICASSVRTRSRRSETEHSRALCLPGRPISARTRRTYE